MKFIAIVMMWSLLVVIPAAAVWGNVAATIGIRPLPFGLSLIYGVILISTIPYIVLWKFPNLCR